MSLSRHNLELDGTVFQYWLFITEDGRRYCKLKDLATLLGYVDPKRAYHLVDEEWKINWSCLAGESFPTPSNWQSTTLFVFESGIYSLVTRSRKPQAKRISHQLFQTFARVERTVAEIESMVAERDETIAERDRLLAERDRRLTQEIEEKCRLMNIVAILRPKVAVIPDRDSVRHTLCIYRQGNTNYKCIRTQKRNLEKACSQIPEDYELLYSRDNVPNALNVINRLKEKLPRDAQFKHNNIVTDAPVVDLINECIEGEINRQMLNNM